MQMYINVNVTEYLKNANHNIICVYVISFSKMNKYKYLHSNNMNNNQIFIIVNFCNFLGNQINAKNTKINKI